MKILIFVLLISVFPTALAVQQSGKQEIPGTRISLSPPEGFIRASHFSGFWQESLGATVVGTEFGGPMADAVRVFDNSQAMASRGMTLLNKEKVTVGKFDGVLFHISLIGSGVQYLQWMLVLGEGEESVLIAASLPKARESELSAKMKASVLTTTWDRTRQILPTEGLSFTLAEKGDLKLAKRTIESLLYSKQGILPVQSIEDPLFVLSRAIRKVQIDNKEQFAKSRLLETVGFKQVEIGEMTAITIDGLSGYEIVGKGIDESTGIPLMVYQVILYGDQTYYLMQGLCSSKRSSHYLPVFKEMVHTFKLKK